MKRVFAALVILLVLGQSGVAQPRPDTLWTTRINVSGDEWARCVVPLADGYGYLVASGMLLHSVYESMLIRLNNIGGIFWSDVYGGDDDDEARWVAECANGDFLIVGRTQSWGAGSSDMFVLRTNNFGDSTWLRTYGSTATDWGTVVEETADRGIMIAGFTAGWNATEHDLYLVKANRHGVEQWHRLYGRPYNDECYAAQETADSGFVLAGFTEAPELPNPTQMYLVRTDSTGDTLWTRDYGGPANDAAYGVQQTRDGGFILAGYTTQTANYKDVYLVKTNTAGDTVWTRTFGGPGDQWAYSVQQTSDDGYIAAGYTIPYGQNHRDMYLVKTDADGNLLWTRTHGRAGTSEEAYCIRETPDRGYILAGCACPGGIDCDVYVVKTGPDSVLTAAADEPFRPRPDRLGLTAYPNPFNPQTTLRLTLPARAWAALEIFDLTGRQVRSLHGGLLDAGEHELPFDGRDLPAGLYFARFRAAGVSVTQKLLLVR